MPLDYDYSKFTDINSIREAFNSGKFPFSYIKQKLYTPMDTWNESITDMKQCPKCGTYFNHLVVSILLSAQNVGIHNKSQPFLLLR